MGVLDQWEYRRKALGAAAMLKLSLPGTLQACCIELCGSLNELWPLAFIF